MASFDDVEIRPAATILLLRDAAGPERAADPAGTGGLEVFMVERHHKIDFATGALVFPGGRVEEADADPALRAYCRGVDGLDDAARGFRVAAIRETFEECGVLLARPRGSDALVDATRLRDLEKRYRDALQSDGATIDTLARDEDLELACDLLVHFAHWITPPVMPKRFDTHFFLVPAPADHLAAHDGVESVDSVWTTVADALAAEREGRRTIIFPTKMQLEKLSRSHSVAEAVAAANASPVVTVLPRVERGADGKPTLHIPAEAGYDFVSGPTGDLP